ncbi:MAG TPA: NAD(P)-binding protein [Solirubrobacteraceae bacterium]|jgi:phytoene dehydrogenase-like protein|nr:NAD(P)-binding protein [Solirubrobacteraceae bacterium]
MSASKHTANKPEITIVGAGIAGLVAAIACAEEGANVRLVEAHESLGGRGRSSDGPYRANLGPHAMYHDGPFWRWMRERDVLPPNASPRLTGIRLRLDGTLRRTPPLGALPAVLRLRGREAPVNTDFRTWVASHTDESTAEMLSAGAGVFTFHHDPGELSADFVWSRMVRLLLTVPSIVRYPVGGWSSLIDSLECRVRELGVVVEVGTRVDVLPEAPVIVATELDQARELIGDDSLRWNSGRTVCLDLGVHYRRGDPTVVSDMDEAGWIGRYSAANPSIAPDGEELIQAQMPIRPGESADQAALRLERLLDVGLDEWRGRETWRRRQVMDGRSGALDMPGTSWRERPAVDRGDGVFLAGDTVAAPGMLAEVSWASALEASRLALQATATMRPKLREVA